MNIQCKRSGDGIYTLCFDRPDSSANLFDEDTLRELEEHIDALAQGEKPAGLVFLSAKPGIFIAGADLKILAGDLSGAELADFVERGQRLMQKVADLPFPTVAAIHGACLGGGYELALACDYRVATTDRATKIGLPETRLGILPAWGGCTRLPRLIGLPKALDIILGGKTPPAKLARKLGMIDALAPRESLEKAARIQIARGKRKRRPRFHLLHSRAGRTLILRGSRQRLRTKTRGLHPAVGKALGVVIGGLPRSISESLRMEKEALVDLARTPECRHLLEVFFLTERAKHPRSAAGVDVAAIHRAAVFGAGTMGAGIAQWMGARGVPVILRDVSAEALARGTASIAKLNAQAVAHHVLDPHEARAASDLIHPSSSSVPLRGVDLVIEAALEELAVKKTLFAELEGLTPPETILATNTSALSIREIGDGLAHPERVLGLHFFNPVGRMPLVEVIHGPATSDQALATALRFVVDHGKLPVVVRDSPGFLVNRILMPYLIEAVLLYEEGHAVEVIDEAMLDFGMPMGPLRLLDEIGHDIALHVAGNLGRHFADHLPESALLEGTVGKGWLGKKSQKGFYHYTRKNGAPNAGLDLLVARKSAGEVPDDTLAWRMVLPMLNEAARCVEEKVAENAADVDFAMIMGTGFAPFRGGPLRYADDLGAAAVVGRMQKEAEAGRNRYAPCALLRSLAAEGRHFYEKEEKP